MCLECGDDFLSVANVGGGRREGRVDDRHLRRVDCQLAREALAARRLGFGAQAVLVLEVGEDTVDRLDAGGRCARQA